MQTIATLRNVTKRFVRGAASVDVLRALNLDITTGEFLALMGPSGSGKTTLLNLLAGLDRVDEGDITVAGEHINELGSTELARWRARHVGFIFQMYNLLPALSAHDNVELPLLLTNLSLRKRRQQAQAALNLVGLAERVSHKPAELSGGQQQRVAIARALVADPTLLICDEPTGDLDRESADDILSLLQALNSRHGKTVIMVTHDPRAAACASRILQIDKGSLAEQKA